MLPLNKTTLITIFIIVTSYTAIAQNFFKEYSKNLSQSIDGNSKKNNAKAGCNDGRSLFQI